MKPKVLLLAIPLTAALCAAAGVYIFRTIEQDQVRQLLETRECRGCDLSGANLARLNLEDVNLEDANLVGADLQGARLKNANLQRTNLQRANLEQADLGCTAFSFSVRSDERAANLDFSVDDKPQVSNPQDFPTGLNLQTTDRGATLSLNLGGCADLTDATLQGATMPDGSIHP